MNQVFTHPGQPQMQAEVILASKGPDQKPIYTIRMRYPRPIHGEIMTHRVFGRNARSSRAVPVKTMLNEVRTIPYVPWHWGANQKGMQASTECNELIDIPYRRVDDTVSHHITYLREEAWLQAATLACDAAEAFMNAGYHKQNPNRLLEPFSWIDTLVTSTEWNNFFWLRDHKDAEPHLQDLARLVKQAIDEAEVQILKPGKWHLPYIKYEDYTWAMLSSHPSQGKLEEFLCKISAARCARISYKPFDGDASYEKELQRYDSLVSADRVHASPTEHQATPDTKSWQETVRIKGNVTTALKAGNNWDNPDLHGNLTNYIQFRKTVPNENHS